jgi:hypothetical protein
MNADFRTNFSPNDDDADEPRFGELLSREERMKMLEESGYSGEKWHQKEPKSYLGTVIYGALVSCLAAGVLLILSFL